MSTQEQNTPTLSENRTEYRKVNDGYYWFLEYKSTVRIFGFKLFSYWSRIPRAFYDKILGQLLDTLDTEGNISSWHENLDEFVSKWPDINLYFPHYQAKQKSLEDQARKYHEDKDRDRGKIVKMTPNQ